MTLSDRPRVSCTILGGVKASHCNALDIGIYPWGEDELTWFKLMSSNFSEVDVSLHMAEHQRKGLPVLKISKNLSVVFPVFST